MRRARLELISQGNNISRNIAPYFTSFSFTDNSEGKADDVKLTLEDTRRLWQGAWFPGKGDMIRASIVCENWERPGDNRNLYCGTFSVDEIELLGPPDAVSLGGVSSFTTTALRREKKSRAWENSNLETIAGDIAKENGMDLFYQGPVINFVRRDQREQSDLSFLQSLASESGLSVKVSDKRLILFDGKKQDATSPVATVRRKDALKRFSLKTKTHDVFKACQVTYWDPKEKAQKKYLYTPPGGSASGQVLKINTRVESIQEAIDKAKKQLRKKNRFEVTGSLTVMGNPLFQAGFTINLEEFGKFDGRFFIDTARHDLSGSGGYSTDLTIRKVLDY
ncbi:MAG: hypothetical protein JEZ12_26215 [Desulfobacterium sp.]|nr:hypothetical protein [Desulfobacterium sp.]